jgi:NAD(P)-dependent dehydrogenase (short-subunit alcohol dehydrogenase family)
MADTQNSGNSMFDLSGKRAVVTGAGRGIGQACALALAQAGADVGLVARTQAQLDETAASIEGTGKKAVTLSADLTQVEALPELAAKLNQELGGFDILVNNAGINIPQPSAEVTPKAWDQVMDINLRGAFFMAQAAGNVMIQNGCGGRIINMTSQTGSVALIKRAAYCASKAGMNLVTKVLALEWAEHGILVNAVAPTFIENDFTKKMFAEPAFKQYALAKNLLGRFGTGADVAGAVVYLASPAASLVTGHVLMVDAGWTAH